MGLRRSKSAQTGSGHVVVVKGGGANASWYPVPDNEASRQVDRSLEKSISELRRAHVAAQEDSLVRRTMAGVREYEEKFSDTETIPGGVWIAYHYVPCEGFSNVTPFTSAVRLAMFLSENSREYEVKFLSCGEELTP